MSRGSSLYGELWFVALVALLALLFLAIALSLLLQRKLHREPHIRERPPLEPPQKRAPSLGGYPAGAAPMVSVGTRSPVSGSGCRLPSTFPALTVASLTWASPQFLCTKRG